MGECPVCGCEMEEKNTPHRSAMGEPFFPIGKEEVCMNPSCSRFMK